MDEVIVIDDAAYAEMRQSAEWRAMFGLLHKHNLDYRDPDCWYQLARILACENIPEFTDKVMLGLLYPRVPAPPKRGRRAHKNSRTRKKIILEEIDKIKANNTHVTDNSACENLAKRGYKFPGERKALSKERLYAFARKARKDPVPTGKIRYERTPIDLSRLEPTDTNH